MILHILGFAALANLGADFFSQFDRLPNKPFKCNMCLGFWLSIVPFIGLYGGEAPLVSAITGVLSETLYRLINRI